MKKVAIMTWWHHYNFGTALQVTALSRTVKKLGYGGDVINYKPNEKVISLNKNDKKYSVYLEKIKRRLDRKKTKLVRDSRREAAFDMYINDYLTLTQECEVSSDLFKLNQQYDAFICGSDQIWAPSCFNSKYFLDFVEDTNKMIAYAPSIGLFKIEDTYVKERMKECISRFKHLGIREDQGKKLIKELCDKEAEVVLDPTLLLGQEEWDEIASNDIKDENYILCYFLGNNSESWNHIKILSEKTGLKVKVIPIFEEDLKRGFDVEKGIGPKEFLGLVKNSTFICTDSFHGTVFSLIYEKAFYTYERFSNEDSNSQNSRIYNILKIAALENRLVTDKTQVEQDALICDFDDARRNIADYKEKSMRYLTKALQESTNSERTEEYKITNTCCGCGTCTTVCKKNAIDVTRNNKGFLEANIDQEKCVQCGMCKRVCPYNGEVGTKINKGEHKLFMASSIDGEVLRTSSSGGVGYELSKLLCEQGHDVIGCVYDREKQEATHKCVEGGKIEKLHIFQGSKYIQSNSLEVINKLVNESEKGIVFGTPCQIAGIDKVLKLRNKREQFILVDLICHGVPSQSLWSKYIQEGSLNYGYGNKPEVKFRDKPKGWRNKHMGINGNGKYYSCLDTKDLFYRFFLIGHCYAEVCYECAYRTASQADIRIGDYWGPRYKKNKKGVSMIIAMTHRGEQTLNSLYELGRIELQEMPCNEYWEVQYPQNPIKPVFHKELVDELRTQDIRLEEIADKYCKEFEWKRNLSTKVNLLRSVHNKLSRK